MLIDEIRFLTRNRLFSLFNNCQTFGIFVFRKQKNYSPGSFLVYIHTHTQTYVKPSKADGFIAKITDDSATTRSDCVSAECNRYLPAFDKDARTRPLQSRTFYSVWRYIVARVSRSRAGWNAIFIRRDFRDDKTSKSRRTHTHIHRRRQNIRALGRADV